MLDLVDPIEVCEEKPPAERADDLQLALPVRDRRCAALVLVDPGQKIRYLQAQRLDALRDHAFVLCEVACEDARDRLALDARK
jgi:hypothetical protein